MTRRGPGVGVGGWRGRVEREARAFATTGSRAAATVRRPAELGWTWRAFAAAGNYESSINKRRPVRALRYLLCELDVSLEVGDVSARGELSRKNDHYLGNE